MQDLFFIGIVCVFFGSTVLLVRLCDLLAGNDKRGRE
jgi:hypothetical protein